MILQNFRLSLSSTRKLLVFAWWCVAVIFLLFSTYAFYVQIENNNPLLPAIVVGLAGLAAVAFAVKLSKAKEGTSQLTILALISGLFALPFFPLGFQIAAADDAPGAGLAGLMFLGLAIASFTTAWISHRSETISH